MCSIKRRMNFWNISRLYGIFEKYDKNNYIIILIEYNTFVYELHVLA